MFIEDVLKEWKNTAEELLDHNRRNIDDADDTSMLENKHIASKLEYQKKLTTPSKFRTSPQNIKVIEKIAPTHETSFSSVKSLDLDLENKGKSITEATVDEDKFSEKQLSSKDRSSSLTTNNNHDFSNESRHLNHDDRDKSKLPSNLLSGYESANFDNAIKSSHSTPQNVKFETGIKCKDKTTDPKFEMRGTNYWTLYNYIPADEVIISFYWLVKIQCGITIPSLNIFYTLN